MTQLSSEAKRVLEVNGWHEDRLVDVTAYEQDLILAGHRDCKKSCEFLRHYGDLEVQIDPDIDEYCLNTSLSRIMNSIPRAYFRQMCGTGPVSHFSREAGRTLFIIGTCGYDFFTLTMDSDGSVYRNKEWTSQNFGGLDLHLIASSGEEAIEKLILEDRTGVEIQREWVAHKE